jgi:hypothetical protein
VPDGVPAVTVMIPSASIDRFGLLVGVTFVVAVVAVSVFKVSFKITLVVLFPAEAVNIISSVAIIGFNTVTVASAVSQLVGAPCSHNWYSMV